jgi:hypothetical protein
MICRFRTSRRYGTFMRHRKDTLLIHIQLSPESHFTNDLGLDSLDTVEVVMAIEEVGHNL